MKYDDWSQYHPYQRRPINVQADLRGLPKAGECDPATVLRLHDV